MQILNKKKLIIFSDKELTDPLKVHGVNKELLSVMIFPEDEKKQDHFRLGTKSSMLDRQCSPEQKKTLLRSDPEVMLDLLDRKDEALKIRNAAFYSRKKGNTGAPIVRGMIAGQLLCFLILAECGTLERAYDQYTEEPIYVKKYPEPANRSVLKNIWLEYRNISPLWAAHQFSLNCKTAPPIPFFQPATNPELAMNLWLFLRTASFFRKELLEVIKPSTGTPLIEDPDTVWNLLTEDNRVIPALKLSLKKNQ